MFAPLRIPEEGKPLVHDKAGVEETLDHELGINNDGVWVDDAPK